MCAHGKVLQKKDKIDEKNLISEARAGNFESVISLLFANADVNERNEFGETPLIVAVNNNRLSVVEVLLDANADVDARDNDGETALIKTVRRHHIIRNHLDIMNKLLKANANTDVQDNFGITALMWASIHSNSDCARGLIDAKADVNIKDLSGKNALTYAAKNGWHMIEIIFIAGGDMNMKNTNGDSIIGLILKNYFNEPLIPFIKEWLIKNQIAITDSKDHKLLNGRFVSFKNKFAAHGKKIRIAIKKSHLRIILIPELINLVEQFLIAPSPIAKSH